MNGDAADLAVVQFAFAGMESGPQLESKLSHRLVNRARAADGPCRTIKGRKEPVAGGVYLASPETIQLAPDQLVMLLEQLLPVSVAERSRRGSRADDVGEQNGKEPAVWVRPPADTG